MVNVKYFVVYEHLDCKLHKFKFTMYSLQAFKLTKLNNNVSFTSNACLIPIGLVLMVQRISVGVGIGVGGPEGWLGAGGGFHQLSYNSIHFSRLYAVTTKAF